MTARTGLVWTGARTLKAATGMMKGAAGARTKAATLYLSRILEAVYRQTAERHPTGTGDELLSAADDQKCPRCGRILFRTGIAVRLDQSEDQEPPRGQPGRDYDVHPVEFSDD